VSRSVRLGIFAVALIGYLAGLAELAMHVASDPLADVHAYYDAGARLNAGLPLYPASADPNVADFYRYPPLTAIVFRPLAALPFPLAAGAWEALVLAAFALTLWRIGVQPRVLVVLGLLALPTAWVLAVGQAQALVTLLLVIGAPWAVALAGQLKLFPALVALYWVGRGDWRSFGRFVAWSAGFMALQLVLAPRASLDFLGTLGAGQIGHVNNFSPWVISPWLWGVLFVVGVGATLALARTRWGWAAAVVLGTLAPPRLLTYMLSSLIAALGQPDQTANLRHGVG
jgi:hypothetical protein